MKSLNFLRRNNNRQAVRSGGTRVLAGSIALLAAALLPAPQASAVVYYWDSTAAALRGTPGNWTTSDGGTLITGRAVPGGADIAVFNDSSINGAETIMLAGPQSVVGVVFSNTRTSLIESISATPQVLTLGASGLTINAGAGAVTIGRK